MGKPFSNLKNNRDMDIKDTLKTVKQTRMFQQI